MMKLTEMGSLQITCHINENTSNGRCGGAIFAVKMSIDQTVAILVCAKCGGETLMVQQ